MAESNKASWTPRKTKIFTNLCLHEVDNGNRKPNGFSTKGWENIIKGLQQQADVTYTKDQLKNYYNQLKLKWRGWEILKNMTGVTFDPITNAVNIDQERWIVFLQANKSCASFKKSGLANAEELGRLFSGMVPFGEHSWSPSMGTHPVFAQHVDIEHNPEEGSGDSDDLLDRQSPPTPPNIPRVNSVMIDNIESQSSSRKRRSDGSSCGNKKKCKNSRNSKIDQAMDIISRTYLQMMDPNSGRPRTKYDYCVEALEELKVAERFGGDCYLDAMDILQGEDGKNDNADVFLSLKPDMRLEWLNRRLFGRGRGCGL